MSTILKKSGKRALWCMICGIGLCLPTSLAAKVSLPNNAPQLCTVDDEPVLSDTEVDSMAQFPGGEVALMRHFAQNIKYPDAAMKEGIQGAVMVSFVITSKGTVAKAKVEKSVDPLLDAEALRVVNALPKFKPAQKNGKAVAVKFMLPVKFRLH